MNRILWLATVLVLATLIVLSVVRPHLMVSPGDLVPAHARLQDDCFACHAPLRGASAQRCMACHKVAEIGLRTTTGQPVVRKDGRPPFHQSLREPDCVACHSDHPRPALTGTSRVRFAHDLLRPAAAARCAACHRRPADAFHRTQSAPCSTCHQPPRWKPATFDHDRYFVLDRHHAVTCTTCHTGGNYRHYTCYGCHEHQPVAIIAEHREEGIANVENCARCHRSARGEPEERDGRREGEGGGDRRGDDD